MKRNVTLYLDSNLVELSLNSGLNLSQEVNNFLKGRLVDVELTKSTDLENIDRVKLDIQNKIISLNKEIENLNNKKELLREKEDKELERRLEELTNVG